MATVDSDSIPIPIPTPTPRVAPNRPAVRGKPKPRLLGVVDYSSHRAGQRAMHAPPFRLPHAVLPQARPQEATFVLLLLDSWRPPGYAVRRAENGERPYFPKLQTVASSP
jgi:hypothetical protein